MSLYRPVKIGSLIIEGNLFLAPVAGYTDRAFRSICAEQGASFSFTELVSAEALCRNPRLYNLSPSSVSFVSSCLCENPSAKNNLSDANLIRRGESEKLYAVQLFAAEPDTFYKAASLLAPLRPNAIDINCGCPVPKVVKNGAGSALMKNPTNIGKVVEATVRASRESLGDIPVTIKIRSGWDSSLINYNECARIAVEAGAAMVTLHPRTRAQGYGGRSDWSHLADLSSRISVPVTGSGDLYTPQDARQMLCETGCAAVMFARGAMGNPFIFSATKSLLESGSLATESPARESSLLEKSLLEKSLLEKRVAFDVRIATAIRHLEMLAADIGERTACLEMRKQFCAYTKGIAGGAALREKAVHAETIDEYKKIAAQALSI